MQHIATLLVQHLQAAAKRLQHFNATYRNIVGRNMLRASGHPVVSCCDMLGIENRTSAHARHRKFAIHGLPVTLRMFTVKSDKSDWFLQSRSKTECRWTWPKVAIFDTDQKERSLWGPEWHEPGKTTTTSSNIHKCCIKNLSIFKFEPTALNIAQHLATCLNRVAKRAQHQCCAQQCCDRLSGALQSANSSLITYSFLIELNLN